MRVEFWSGIYEGGSFLVAAGLILISSVGMVLSRRPLYGALWLVSALLGTAVVYALLHAHFLAAAQLLVYAGAVVVLVLIVLMLLGGNPERYRLGAFGLGFLAIVFGVILVWGLTPGFLVPLWESSPASDLGTVQNLGRALYGRFVFPFEAASLLILTALVGALMLARRLK
ncbi:MAG: NADH-quinone oxidoreductase subunit J [Deltaproteobacteria bacterium]|nr:NADH-quinone oxidoreductase subunit J [Deltaproteobacteria bacterium]